MKQYDYLVVGAGLFGAVFAQQAKQAGKSVLVIDKRDHIAGNVYTQEIEGINVHVYGAHIFHTNDRKVWDYVTRFAEFNRFTNSPVANYKGELYSLPFNMYTFNKMWGVVRIWRSRLFRWLVPIFTKSWSKVIQRSSGEENVEIFRLLLLNGCLCG